MRSHALRIIAIGCLLMLAAAAPAQKRKAPFYVHPGKDEALATMPSVVARQKCGNWAWAAALEASLRAQDVSLDQTFWVLRLNRGELCLPDAGAPEQLVRFLESETWILDDGRKLNLKATYSPMLPHSVDDFILALRQNRLLILYWRGYAHLLVGMTYDEYLGPNNTRRFEVRTLRLLDPYRNPGDKDRVATFTKGTDDIGEFTGMMQVQVIWQ